MTGANIGSGRPIRRAKRSSSASPTRARQWRSPAIRGSGAGEAYMNGRLGGSSIGEIIDLIDFIR